MCASYSQLLCCDICDGVIVVDESASAALSVVDHCYLLSSGSVRTAGPASAFVGSELLAAGYVDQE